MIVSSFLFNRKTKSDLSWAFTGLIDGGRIKEYADDGADITRFYRHQLAARTYEVVPGPGKLLRWSVPASRGHDDLLISTALTARVDAIGWRDRTARGSLGRKVSSEVKTASAMSWRNSLWVIMPHPTTASCVCTPASSWETGVSRSSPGVSGDGKPTTTSASQDAAPVAPVPARCGS